MAARRILIVALMLTFAPFEATTQQPPTPRASPARAVDSTSLQVLRAQNELMREYHERILDTVYWALGAVGLITGVLLGFGWYVNFRVYERDKAALRQELAASVREDAAKVQEQLHSQFAESQKAAANAGEAAAEKVRKELVSLRDTLQQTFLGLAYSVAELEADKWEGQKIYTNVLRSGLKMVELAQNRSHDFFVSRGLDRMANAFKSGATPDADLSRAIVKALDGLPPQFAAEVAHIRERLHKARA